MIVHDNCDQGSLQWLELRLGIPTASEFKKIVTPTGKLSAQSRTYAFRLVTERLLNRSLDSIENLEWVERGKEVEPQAVKMYEFEQEVETKAVAFITTDDGQIGCSPDRLLVGVNGALELKCPAPQTHVGYMVDGFGNDYMPQVQGQMLVGGFDFIDRYSFHPELPPHKDRTYRDEKYIKLLDESLKSFNDMKNEMLEKIRQQGFFAERDKLLTAVDTEYRNQLDKEVLP